MSLVNEGFSVPKSQPEMFLLEAEVYLRDKLYGDEFPAVDTYGKIAKALESRLFASAGKVSPEEFGSDERLQVSAAISRNKRLSEENGYIACFLDGIAYLATSLSDQDAIDYAQTAARSLLSNEEFASYNEVNQFMDFVDEADGDVMVAVIRSLRALNGSEFFFMDSDFEQPDQLLEFLLKSDAPDLRARLRQAAVGVGQIVLDSTKSVAERVQDTLDRVINSEPTGGLLIPFEVRWRGETFANPVDLGEAVLIAQHLRPGLLSMHRDGLLDERQFRMLATSEALMAIHYKSGDDLEIIQNPAAAHEVIGTANDLAKTEGPVDPFDIEEEIGTVIEEEIKRLMSGEGE